MDIYNSPSVLQHLLISFIKNLQVYSGFAQRNLFNGLEARTLYRYRIKYKSSGKETPWSRPVEVMTTKKPPSAEDLHKAVARDDSEAVLKLLGGMN